MPTFRVLIPYTERDHNYPDGRVYQIDFEVDADDWLTALRMALDRFSDYGSMDYHSWHCEPTHDGLEVVELETGRRFHITDADDDKLPEALVDIPEASTSGSLPYSRLFRILREEGAPRELVGKVLDICQEALVSDAGSVLLLEPDGKELTFLEVRGGAADEVMKYRLKIGQGIAGWCAAHGETLTVAEAAEHPNFFKKISDDTGYQTKSIICAPCRAPGQIVGVLELLNRQGSPRYPTVEVLFAEACARVIALLLAAEVGWERRPSVSDLRAMTAPRKPSETA